MKRFDKVAPSIWDLSPEVVPRHLVTALKPGSFSDSFCKKLIDNMDELRQRVEKFMQLEELEEFKTKLIEDVEIRKIGRETPQAMRPP